MWWSKEEEERTPMWWSKEDTPDGSPLSEWAPHMFEPQPDITAYEMALIYRRLSGKTFRIASEPVYIKKIGMEALFPEFDQVARHFRLIDEQANS